MGPILVGLNHDIGWTKMIQSELEDIWIHLTGDLAFMDFIPSLVLRDIIFVTTNILIGGVRSSIFHRSSRNPSLLLLMGM